MLVLMLVSYVKTSLKDSCIVKPTIKTVNASLSRLLCLPRARAGVLQPGRDARVWYRRAEVLQHRH